MAFLTSLLAGAMPETAGPAAGMVAGIGEWLRSPLNLLLLFPMLGMVVLMFFEDKAKVRAVALWTTIATFVLSVGIALKYDFSAGGYAFDFSAPWFPSVGIHWRVGVDGIALPLILLTTLVSISAVVSSRGIQERVRLYHVLFLLLEASLLGVLVARDYFVFFIFWELMLLPMFFLIGIWGGKNRIYASIKFFLYTLLGSVALLIGIIVLYWGGQSVGMNTFDISRLAAVGASLPVKGAGLGLATQTWLFLLFFVGFGVKVPIVPLHTWLPDAHVQAPTPISMMLAAVLLKMGTYGFIRVVLPSVPDALRDPSGIAVPIMVTVGVVSMLYAAFAAMAQRDWKSMVAYSSISHMGYLIFALASQTDVGLSAAMFIMISHGLISACMFHLVGVVYDRTHNRDLYAYGGLGAVVPTFFTVWIFVGMANLGLPGLSGFWGEFMTFVAAFSRHDWSITLPVFGATNFFRFMAVIGAVTIVVTAAYMLLMLQRVFMGTLNEKWQGLKDMTRREIVAIVPLMVLILLYGLFPSTLVGLYDATTNMYAGAWGYTALADVGFFAGG